FGSRYYTYIYSVSQLMKVCNKYQKKIVILDRPNPLGGEVIEGFLPDKGYWGEVCWGNVPSRHGLTIGESALYIKKTNAELKSLELSVIKMDGWFYDLQYPHLDLQWFPPSPNIPSFESALCYVGTCLFEGTNVSEGRGTEYPFQTIGAPWLNPELILSSLSKDYTGGFDIEACSFKPIPMPGKATNPKYVNEFCNGLSLKVKDFNQARPFMLTLELIRLIQLHHPEHFEFNNHFDKLSGISHLRTMIEKNKFKYNSNSEKEIQKYLTTRPYLYTKYVDEKKIIENI
ncbi:MAG: DUF1343 domain-containing protein, partial [Candidatus Hydrogenedens sp.]